MLEMERPKIQAKEISENGTYGKFVISPLERGFGNTLGNSLRRVLLSLLPGTAATSIKIDNVTHEFSTIPGIKEDVTEIVLNVKSIIAKLNCEGPKVVEINAKGPRQITAKDIIHDSEVEILNPGLHIADLSDDASLRMEITFDKGRGYVPAERNKSEEDDIIGILPVDSIYTPVVRVNYNVENARVGQMTDYDKLMLEVWTNGVITAEEAVSIAAKVLIDHLELLFGLSDIAIDTGYSTRSEVSSVPAVMNLTIEELELSARAENCLKRSGIETVRDLIGENPENMLKIRNLGKKSLDEVIEKLRSMGLEFKTFGETEE